VERPGCDRLAGGCGERLGTLHPVRTPERCAASTASVSGVPQPRQRGTRTSPSPPSGRARRSRPAVRIPQLDGL